MHVVIPAEARIQTPLLQKQGAINEEDTGFNVKPWIPPYQVRGRLLKCGMTQKG